MGFQAGTKMPSATLIRLVLVYIVTPQARDKTGGVSRFPAGGGQASPFRNLKGFRDYDAVT
jgi:hypothetical protein